jgi:hypothetical protein
MLTCSADTASTNKNLAMEELWSSLSKLGTHKNILECFKYGLSLWSASTGGDPLNARAPTGGLINPLNIAFTQAFHNQCTIGWEHVL